MHFSRWGDGAEHFHLWFFPHPEGLVQCRGYVLPQCDEILPPRPLDEWQQTLRDVAAALSS